MERKSNIEILRIISIFLIIAHHIAMAYEALDIVTNKMLIGVFYAGGKIGVNIFILITCYFIGRKTNYLMQAIKIWLQVIIYSWLIMAVAFCFNIGNINFKIMLTCFLPITAEAYWFCSAYIGFLLLVLYVKKAADSLGQQMYKKLLFLLTLMMVIIPTITISDSPWLNNLIWFFYLYLVVYYIESYQIHVKWKRKTLFFIGGGCYLFIILSIVFMNMISYKVIFFQKKCYYFSAMNSLPAMLCSISIFYFMIKTDIGRKKWINRIAGTSFGVYLIHCHPIIKSDFFNQLVVSEKTGLLLVGDIIFKIIIVYGICSIISLELNYICRCISIDKIIKKIMNK